MIFPKAKKIARELGWHKTSDSVFGLYKGYFFEVGDGSLLSNPQYKYVSATVDTLTNEQIAEIKSTLEANKKTLKFSNFEIGEASIHFQYLENLTFTKLKTVYALLDFLVELFKGLNIPEQDKCHSCGVTENISYNTLNDKGIILCTNCFRQVENNFYALERERVAQEKNYMTGFIGSVVFSIPGIIAWVLVAVYLDRLASAMAIAIAILGIKGYDFFKGRQGKLTKYLIVLSNIVSIALANVVTIIALLMMEGLTIDQSIIELQANEVAKDLLFKNTMISFVLAFFVWIWLLFSLKEQKMTLQAAERL